MKMEELTQLKAGAHDQNMLLARLQKELQDEAKIYNDMVAQIKELETSSEA